AEVEAAFQSAGNPIKNGVARCLCHDDKNPSMSVSVKDGALLVHCFSCDDSKQDKLFKAAVNLVRGDNKVVQLPPKKKTPPAKPQKDFSKEWGSYRQVGETEFLYCKKKGVKPYGLKLSPEGYDSVPMRADGGTGVVVGIQLRSDKDVFGYDGDKRDMHSLKDSAKTGAAHIVGELTPGVQVAVCEGYATAASVYEATGIVSACAFGVGNVIGVVEAIRAQGYQPFCVFDDDKAGHAEATKAQSMGLRAILPSFDGVEGRQAKKKKPDEWEDNDFNDLAKLAGADVVKAQVLEGLEAPLPEVDQVELPAARKSKKRACLEDYIELLEVMFPGRKPRRDLISDQLRVFFEGRWKPLTRGSKVLRKIARKARDSEGYFSCSHDALLDYYVDYETTLKPELLLDIEEWDGVDWLKVLTDCLNAECFTPEQVNELIVDWLVKAYQRALNPKVQNRVLILEGAQG
ncbi:MAG: hypothetical protein EBZ77_15640, partial [Chitinophagia bacterium]|nr:hypothetical protein [Chitinophagia bacterium]